MSETSPKVVFDTDQSNFDAEVLQRSHQTPIIVDFWASWCGPCRMLAPVLEAVVQKSNGKVLLAKVNTDENQQLAGNMRISALPTIVAFRDGKELYRFEGVLPERQLQELVNKLVPSEADNIAKQAQSLEDSDPQEAETLYRNALESDPDSESAGLGLARILIKQGSNLEEAKGILEKIALEGDAQTEVEKLQGVLSLKELSAGLPPLPEIQSSIKDNPKSGELHYQLGCALAAEGDYEQALASLLAAGERDHQLAAGKVREAMVTLFHIVGDNDPLSNKYRGQLAGLLY